MLSVSFRPEARQDLRDAIAWYADQRPGLDGELRVAIDEGIEAIRAHPRAWPPTEHSNRRYLLGKFPYSVVYRIEETRILVVAIAHHRRHPGAWKDR